MGVELGGWSRGSWGRGGWGRGVGSGGCNWFEITLKVFS